jgi:hypothetical protein
LLIDNYVKSSDKAVMLAPTSTSLSLQLDHMLANSRGLQFIAHMELTSPLGAADLMGLDMAEVASKFTSWRVKENDLAVWSEPDVVELFRPVLVTERKSKRVGSTVKKIRVVTSFKKETLLFIESLRGEEDDAIIAMVDE